MLRRLLEAVTLCAHLLTTVHGEYHTTKHLIIDTDIFSAEDDAAALLLASTLPKVNLLAVNVNYPSSYSALAASAIVAHYGHVNIPVGFRRPISNATFFDDWFYETGEFASKVAYHYSNGTLTWGNAHAAWDPVALYRKTLSEQKDGSVTIASIGFLENLSGLLSSTSDAYSHLSGPFLIRAKVSELVIMGGRYPSGSEYNFRTDNPTAAAHVVNTWPGRITFSGAELNVTTGAALTREAPPEDPVAAAYRWHIGYNRSRGTWDPLAMLYACQGLGEMFEYDGQGGYNSVFANGSNEWVWGVEKDQRWLKLKTDNVTAANDLERLYLKGVRLQPCSDSCLQRLGGKASTPPQCEEGGLSDDNYSLSATGPLASLLSLLSRLISFLQQ